MLLFSDQFRSSDSRNRRFSGRCCSHRFFGVLLVLMASFPDEVGSWVALSKDGYVVTEQISLNNGVLVEGDMLVNGVVRSANYTWLGPSSPNLECSVGRRGAIRWSVHGDFEGCDGGRWIPVKLCSRHCGFYNPPPPTLRASAVSNATCSQTECPKQCVAKRVNSTVAPNMTIADCTEVYKTKSSCERVTAQDPSISRFLRPEFFGSDAWVCQGDIEPVCTTYDGDRYCSAGPKPGMPFRQFHAISRISFLYKYDVNEILNYKDELIRDTQGKIVQLEFDDERMLQAMYLIDSSTFTSLEGRIKIWGPELNIDPTLTDAFYVGEAQKFSRKVRLDIYKRLPARNRLPRFWDQWNVALDSKTFQLAEPKPTTCSQILSGINLAQFDYLKIFYNVSGWEQLLWRDKPDKIRLPWAGEEVKCQGETRVSAPWSYYDRLDPPDVIGVISSGRYLANVVGNITTGKDCVFHVEPPIGFVTRIKILRIDLSERDRLIITDEQKYEGEPTAVIYNFTGGYHNATEINNTTDGTFVLGSHVNRPVTIHLHTTGERNGTGFVLEYDFVPRQYFMQEAGDATLLQFSLAVLEAQGASMPDLGWNSINASRHALRHTPPPGDLSLGPINTAEQCYLCCGLGEDYSPSSEDVAKRFEESKRDGTPLPTRWQPRSGVGADVGATSAASMFVKPGEIPPLVGYMGYKVAHFVRTAHVSSFPPGSIRAPYGVNLGERPVFDLNSGNDLPQRPDIGWGMKRIMLEQGGSFGDDGKHGWGTGWGNGDEKGKGTHWRNGDGASASWFPSWQLLANETSELDDKMRWEFDLDHPDLPLFSFVDQDRRIVMANEMALALPCGLQVNNTCGVDCGVVGTGLNIMQCLSNVEITPCLQTVADDCNNDCGLTGTKDCFATLNPASVRITALNITQATSSFEISVGMKTDLNDGLNRTNRMTGLALDGSKAADGEGWVHPSTSSGVFGTVDNSMVFSFHDPSNDGQVLTELDGKLRTAFFSRTEILMLQSLALDIPLPRDCYKKEKDCKFRDPINDVAAEGVWFNNTYLPWWDTNPVDKRAGFKEFEAIVRKNIKILSLLFPEELSQCRGLDGDAIVCEDGKKLISTRFVKQFGYIGSSPAVFGGTPQSCRAIQDKTVIHDECFLSVENLDDVKAQIELVRRRALNSIGRRPRFNMAKIKRIISPGGFEFASPDPTEERIYNHNVNTLRISSMFEAVGEYIRIGSSRHLNISACIQYDLVPCLEQVTTSGTYLDDGLFTLASGWHQRVVNNDDKAELCNVTFCDWNVTLDMPTMSHVFFDGIIKEKIPFRFDGASLGNGSTSWIIEVNRRGMLGRGAPERPKVDPNHPHSADNVRVITLPDASGKIITSNNTEEISRLPGLRRKSISPFRYDSSSMKTLEDGRTVLGNAHWYKRMQGSATGYCGTYDDGTLIPCPTVKTEYDSLEASGSEGDEIFIYTSDTILQGANLTNQAPSATPDKPRLDCGPLRNRCQATDLHLYPAEFHGFEIKFATKGIELCVARDRKIYDAKPVECNIQSAPSCAASSLPADCVAYPTWGNVLGSLTFFTKWNSLASFKALGMYPQAWVFDFDFLQARKTITKCADVEQMRTSPNLDFLHIYYSTAKGRLLLENLEKELYLSNDMHLRNETSLRWYALKYLDFQGVASLTIDGKTFVVKSALLQDDENAQEQFMWHISVFEQCFACCVKNRDLEALAQKTAVTTDFSDCPWLNVSDLQHNAVAEGAYYLQKETSFGRPVWKQTPGNLYLHFLPSACMSVHCGLSADMQLENRGAAWVIGPIVGSDVVVVYSLLPGNQGGLNGTWTPTDNHNYLANTSRGYVWYHPIYFGEVQAEAISYNQSIYGWKEHIPLLMPGKEHIPPLMPGNQTLRKWNWIRPSENVGLACSVVPLYRYATTAIVFEDPEEYRKLSIPDADGIVISRGNLEMVTKIGVQSSPILGRSGEAADGDTATRVKFGVGWQTVKIEEANDMLSIAYSSRKLSYCTVPRATCSYVKPPSEVNLDIGKRSCYPVAPEKIDCPWPGGTPAEGEDFGVDGIVMSEKSDRGSCVSFFPAHEYYQGKGSFNSLGQMLCADLENTDAEFLSLSDPMQPLKEESSPRYWGVGSSAAGLCPATPEYLGKTLNTPTQLCEDYLQAGCQDACLRDKDCVAVRLYPSGRLRCKLLYKCNHYQPKTSTDLFEDRNKTSGGWMPSRLNMRQQELGADLKELAVGANISLHDTPNTQWVVRLKESVQEPCPVHVQLQEPNGCPAYGNHPLRVTWNMTAKWRYQICLADLAQKHSVAELREPVLLNGAIPALSALPMKVNVTDTLPLDGVEVVRIGQQFFSVLGMDPANQQLLLGNAPSADGLLYKVAFHTWNASVVPVEGGFLNTTKSWDIRVPHGVHSLETITEVINREIQNTVWGMPCNVSINIHQPGSGLCGEVAAGSSHTVEEFHCAPSSRYLALKGSVIAAYTTEDDTVQVLAKSSIFDTLGFAVPRHSYMFARPTNSSIPSGTVLHEVMPGAGYVSSGYGHHSGFGLGGQAGWSGFVPLNEQARILDGGYVVWCFDGFGFRCHSDDCLCSTYPVMTTPLILGATKTQRGETPQSTTLRVPSNGDGIILSTGNLEDVTVQSAALSGLRIDALKEKDQSVAARFGGWLQFSACESLFGEANCSLITEQDVSITLGPTRQLAVESYHKKSFWIAIYNASEELHAAARAKDTNRAWELLPMELRSVNRTFAATQDVGGVEGAGLACETYCDNITTTQAAEVVAAENFFVVADSRMPTSVWTTLAEPTRYCVEVTCASSKSWKIQDHMDPYTSCTSSSECLFTPHLCKCTATQPCRNLWRAAKPKTLKAADPWQYSVDWDLCVRSLRIEQHLVVDCAGCTGKNQPDCCQTARNAKEATESWAMFEKYSFMVTWVVKQRAETLQVCDCLELEGAVHTPGFGEYEIMNHVCAVSDTRYVSPVCESENATFAIEANGSSTKTLLNFQRASPGVGSHHLTVPATHGVVLTTGNLESVTKEAGSFTSMHVMAKSRFQDALWVGTVGDPAMSQGSRHDPAGRTVVFADVDSPFCEGTQVSNTAHTCLQPHLNLKLEKTGMVLEDEDASCHLFGTVEVGNWSIDFPAWDDNLCTGEVRSGCEKRLGGNGVASLEGIVITTGNLEDISALSPNLVETSGTSVLHGEVRLGSAHACTLKDQEHYGQQYSRRGWRAHTASECMEVQDQVDWNDPQKVRTANVPVCKKMCEDDPSCEILVVKIGVDRFPVDKEAKCILIAASESKCTMASHPSQDTYLLQRKAPAPWENTNADDAFFGALCDSRNNASHIPGTSIVFNGYLNEGIAWRAQEPMQWKAYPNASCDSFKGFVGGPESLFKATNVSECTARCELSPECGVVTVTPYQDPRNIPSWKKYFFTCALSPFATPRRTLADGSTVDGACRIVPNDLTDLFVYLRDEQIKLTFESPTGSNNLVFSDSTGIVITTGNTYDIDNNVGVTGRDSWRVAHLKRESAIVNSDMRSDVVNGVSESVFSGKSPGFLIRDCFDLSCTVVASNAVSEADLQREIDTHVTGSGYTVDRIVRGDGDGFDQYTTIVDFAVPGSRTSGVCYGECKGTLTCERGTTSCTDECPGYMMNRPGVDMTKACTLSGSRGTVCGCANGEAYNQFGNSVCVMRDSAHADHGRFCGIILPTGSYESLFDCCLDPANCGECVTFPPQKPVGSNNRITFPEATGVVVTTGNIDDVVLKNVQLDGLELLGFVDFGIGYPGDSDVPTLGGDTGYRFDINQDQMRAHIDLHPVSTRVTGGLRMVAGYGSPKKTYGTGTQPKVLGTAEYKKYTHLFSIPPTDIPSPYPGHAERYCQNSVAFTERSIDTDPQQQDWERTFASRCAYKREILLPPTTGTVLLEEHLVDIPAMAIPVEDLHLSTTDSSFIVVGNLTFGQVVNYTTDPFNNGGYGVPGTQRVKHSVARLYNQFDGDVGLTMQSAGNVIPLLPSTQGLSGLEGYGENGKDFPLSGQYHFGGPAPAQVIEDFARDGRVGDGADRSFALDYVKLSMPQGGGVDTATRTYLRGGAPSLPISVQDARSVPSGPNQLSDHFAYRSGQPVLQQRAYTMPSATDSYSPAVDGSPRRGAQALHGSSPINVSWCHKTLMGLPAVDPSNNKSGVRTLSMFMSYMVQQGFLVPTLLPNHFEANSTEFLAFDKDLKTSMQTGGRCEITTDLGAGNSSDVKFIRYAPGEGHELDLVGGKFQGSNDGVTYTDLVEITDVPLGPLYSIVQVYVTGKWRFFRYLGPAMSQRCGMAEIEYHRGDIVIALTQLQHGGVSWMVDEEVLFLRENVLPAMLVKCAAHGMIPSMLDGNIQEINLPEAQGQVITTGNLEDITVERGSFTSMSIAGEFQADGSVMIGVPGKNSLLTVNSVLDGSSYFGFGGPTVEVGPQTSVVMNSMPQDNLVFLDDQTGTVVLGELPNVMGDVFVMQEGGLDFNWNVEVPADLQLGVLNQMESPGSVYINAVVGASRPLAFAGKFKTQEHTSLGAPDASRDSVVTLPDTSGTVVTSSSLPRVLDNVTAVEGKLTGNVVFRDLDLEIGLPGGDDGVSLHANIVGLSSLLFDGSTKKDGRTLMLSALDPDSEAELVLPDTTGTVITSANFPRKFSTLRLLDKFQAMGPVSHSGEILRIGRAGGRSRLEIKAHITGRAALYFDGGRRGVENQARRTAFVMPESSRNNVITFPDVSGTVVTSANQPTRIVTAGTYSVDAESLTVAADSLLLGLGVLDDVEGGTFLFSDLEGKERDHRPNRPNQFSAHCSGGAAFVTGKTPSGKATGAILAPRASSWSYLSDRTAKEAIAPINASQILDFLDHVPVSRWRYDVANPEAAPTHIGPMAQDLFAVFGLGHGNDRIGQSDADGVVLAAVHGLHSRVEALQRELEERRAEVQRQEEERAAQEQRLVMQQQAINDQSIRIQRLWVAAQARGLSVLQ